MLKHFGRIIIPLCFTGFLLVFLKMGQISVWTESKVRLAMYIFQLHSKVRCDREWKLHYRILLNTATCFTCSCSVCVELKYTVVWTTGFSKYLLFHNFILVKFCQLKLKIIILLCNLLYLIRMTKWKCIAMMQWI